MIATVYAVMGKDSYVMAGAFAQKEYAERFAENLNRDLSEQAWAVKKDFLFIDELSKKHSYWAATIIKKCLDYLQEEDGVLPEIAFEVVLAELRKDEHTVSSC